MDYEEMMAILSQFEKQYPFLRMINKNHGSQVVLDNNEFVLQLLFTEPLDDTDLNEEISIPESFTYTYNNDEKVINTKVVISDIPQAHAEQGSSAGFATGIGARFGTLGWNVFLITQNIWVGISNHHVLVDPANPIAGTNVFLNGRLEAQLHAFTLNESWDFALARYNNPADATQNFRLCADGTRYPVVTSLSDKLYPGETYWTVGARPPICSTGQLIGAGNRTIRYNDGTLRSFTGQIIFSKMTDGGDSGSIIVRDKDNTVTGLNFAGHSHETIANPLYQIGWIQVGTIALTNGETAPVFDTSQSRVPVGPTTIHPTHDSFLPSNEIIASAQQAGGLFFVGVALFNQRTNDWEIPIPPDLRPGIAVVSVFNRSYRRLRPGLSYASIDTTLTTNYETMITYLCFG